MIVVVELMKKPAKRWPLAIGMIGWIKMITPQISIEKYIGRMVKNLARYEVTISLDNYDVIKFSVRQKGSKATVEWERHISDLALSEMPLQDAEEDSEEIKREIEK